MKACIYVYLLIISNETPVFSNSDSIKKRCDQIWARRTTILTETISDIPQSSQTNAGILFNDRPGPIHYTSFPIIS